MTCTRCGSEAIVGDVCATCGKGARPVKLDAYRLRRAARKATANNERCKGCGVRITADGQAVHNAACSNAGPAPWAK